MSLPLTVSPPASQVTTTVKPVQNNTVVVNVGMVSDPNLGVRDLIDVNLGAKEDGGVLEYNTANSGFNLRRDLRHIILDGGNF